MKKVFLKRSINVANESLCIFNQTPIKINNINYVRSVYIEVYDDRYLEPFIIFNNCSNNKLQIPLVNFYFLIREVDKCIDNINNKYPLINKKEEIREKLYINENIVIGGSYEYIYNVYIEVSDSLKPHIILTNKLNLVMNINVIDFYILIDKFNETIEKINDELKICEKVSKE